MKTNNYPFLFVVGAFVVLSLLAVLVTVAGCSSKEEVIRLKPGKYVFEIPPGSKFLQVKLMGGGMGDSVAGLKIPANRAEAELHLEVDSSAPAPAQPSETGVDLGGKTK